MSGQYVVLKPGLPPEVRAENLNYGRMVETVGYPAEVLNISPGVVMYVNEESTGPENPEATVLAAEVLRDGGTVKGTAVIAGAGRLGVEDTSLPQEVIEGLLTTLE